MPILFAVVLGKYVDPYPYMYCQNQTCVIPYEGSKLQKIVQTVY